MATIYVDSDYTGGASDGSLSDPYVFVSEVISGRSAGDIVIFAPGWYFLEDEMTAASADGTSGNEIKFIGDIKGEYFTDRKGPVIWAGSESQFYEQSGYNTGRDVQAIDLTGDFYWFEDIVFRTDTQSYQRYVMRINDSYGHMFFRCQFDNTGGLAVIQYDVSTEPLDTTTWDRCLFNGTAIEFLHYENGVAAVDLDIEIKNSIGIAHSYVSGLDGIFSHDAYSGSGAYCTGNINIYSCTFIGGEKVNEDTFDMSGGGGVNMYNCILWSCTPALFGRATRGLDWYAMWHVAGYSGSASASEAYWTRHSPSHAFMGGLTDVDFTRRFGVPLYFLPFEPYHPIGEYNRLVAGADDSYTLSTYDYYGNPRGTGPESEVMCIFDGHNAINDPDAAWSNESALGEIDDPTTVATCTGGPGDVDTNYVEIEGTHYVGNGAIISAELVILFETPPVGTTSGVMGYRVTTAAAAETLATGTFNLPATGSTYELNSKMSTDRISVTAPAAGWTWSDVDDLEIRIWEVSESASLSPEISGAYFYVKVRSCYAPGAVQSQGKPTADASKQLFGKDTLKFLGAGFHQIIVPVPSAATYNINVQVQIDDEYTGTNPQVIVKGLVGEADSTTTISAIVDTWVEEAIEITPTEAGWAAVQVISKDTSGIGSCWVGGVSLSAG